MTKYEFVMRGANKLIKDMDMPRAEALQTAWTVLKALLETECPEDVITETMGICGNCLTGGWLITEPSGDKVCLKCGARYLIIEENIFMVDVGEK